MLPGTDFIAYDGPAVGSTKFFSKANSKPLFYASIAVFGAVLYGYDGTYFTSILAMDQFLRDYGTLQADGTYLVVSSRQSILASAVQIGEFFGSLTAAWIGDHYGRKGGFLGACAYVTVGVIIQIIPKGSVAALGTGRAILGMGVGVISNATPLYLSEVAPTAIRGVVVSSWQLMLAIGQVIGACVGQGTKDITNSASYRIPIGLNLVIVAIICFGMLILPESPRWLLTKGREEQAMKSLRKINSTQEDPELVASTEFKAFVQARQDEVSAQGEGGWGSMLKDSVERRKFICVLGVLICQQIGGVQFIFSYTTTFFKEVGIDDAFLVTIIVDVIEVFGVLCSFLVIPRFGRRPLLIYTSIPMVISLFVCGILGCIDNRNTNENRCIAAMICVYVYFFNVAWGPLAWTMASELATGQNRQKLMSLGTACFWVIAWAVTFTLPYLFNDEPGSAGLGPKIGFIYGPGALIALLFVYFYLPETKGRSLEEINEMLVSRVPTRQWQSYTTSIEKTHAARVDAAAAATGSGAGMARSGSGSDVYEDTDMKTDAKKGGELTGAKETTNATHDA